MIKRYLHRHVNHQCHTPGCSETSKPHNKFYWFDRREKPFEYIHSATFCSNCAYRITTNLPDFVKTYDHHYVHEFRYYKTLKGCTADFLTRVLSI